MIFNFKVVFTNGLSDEFTSYIPDQNHVKNLLEDEYGKGSIKSVEFIGIW